MKHPGRSGRRNDALANRLQEAREGLSWVSEQRSHVDRAGAAVGASCPLNLRGHMDTYGVDLMGRRRRRRHSAEFKAAVIDECMRPGVSIAAVALAHSLNANMLRKWVIDAEHKVPAVKPAPIVAEEAPLPGADASCRLPSRPIP